MHKLKANGRRDLAHRNKRNVSKAAFDAAYPNNYRKAHSLKLEVMPTVKARATRPANPQKPKKRSIENGVQQQKENQLVSKQQDKLKALENGLKKPVKTKKVTPVSEDDFIQPPPPKIKKYSSGKKAKSNLSVSDRDA